MMPSLVCVEYMNTLRSGVFFFPAYSREWRHMDRRIASGLPVSFSRNLPIENLIQIQSGNWSKNYTRLSLYLSWADPWTRSYKNWDIENDHVPEVLDNMLRQLLLLCLCVVQCVMYYHIKSVYWSNLQSAGLGRWSTILLQKRKHKYSNTFIWEGWDLHCHRQQN